MFPSKPPATWPSGSAGSRLVELRRGRSPALRRHGAGASTDEVQRFLTGVWEAGGWDAVEPDRVLATVLFTDIVDSSELGWRRSATARGASCSSGTTRLVRRELARFRGAEVDTAGDGFFASFDGPARGIQCASAIVDAIDDLGLEVRAGLHTGECEIVDGKVAGIAVHTGARVASHADPAEVLVSSTVKDLVAGSGIAFADRGAHELKGVPGEWQLFAVDRVGA